jgi:ABC-type multidrug transport system ATPase subunit
MEPLLQIRDVSKSFGKKRVLDGLSLDLYPGEITGLVGRSGCGKSTLIKILVGYHAPDAGRIIFGARDITKRFSIVRELVGYTTQENSFYEKLTVYENMFYYSSLYNVGRSVRKERINRLLKAVNLYASKDILAGNISGGMKRRLDFAISLLHNPKLVILDEPTTGLDPLLVENFWSIVTEIAKTQEITVLVSSHLLPEVEKYCDKVAVMANGRVKEVMRVRRDMDLEKEFKRLANE